MTIRPSLFTRLLSSSTHHARHVRPARPKPSSHPPQPPSLPKPPLTTLLLTHLSLHTTRGVFTSLLKLFFAYHLLVQYVGFVTLTSGPSMLPTLSVDGDGVLLSSYHRRGRGIKVGDIVAFSHPMDTRHAAMKRVVGMPGDFVCTGAEVKGEAGMIQVPEGHCWVLGDNLPESRDSRVYGPLPLALITAKGVARVWPLSEMVWLHNTLQPPEAEA